MRSFVWTSIIVLVLGALSYGENPEKIRLCKLKNDPAGYRHKLVEIEGFVSRGFENFTFFDPNCPYSPEIWLEYGGTVAAGTIYCCGPTNARSREKSLVVDDVPVPLVDDRRFREFDKLIHSDPDTVVHATLVGRFFPGERERDANGKLGNWGGYGHFGCCSLLAIQQVVSFDPHDRDDLDYRASADQPDLDKLGCGTYLNLESIPSDRATFDIQHSGRIVYQWHLDETSGAYIVVVRRPYWLSFYATDERKVAWIVIAAYKACG